MLLEVENLEIGFRDAPASTVNGAFFGVQPGETVAIVGESGSGKTLSCRAVMGLLPPRAEIRAGRARFCVDSKSEPVDLLETPESKLQRLRGDRISMIFQEPMSALSPLHTIGAQTAEIVRLHRDASRAEAKRLSLDAFERVGFPDPERAWRSYPFELSGGLRQRAMIAMAIISKPRLLIADEPTTALDVTTQALVLNLLKDLQEESGMGVLLITHDLGVVANVADAVVVMRKGRVVEAGDAVEIVGAPEHGYTRKLIAAAPTISGAAEPLARRACGEDAILSLQGVERTFHERRTGLFRPPRVFRALRGVDLTIRRGETMAVVGESGSGKTTLARIALAADRADAGKALFCPEPGDPPIDVHSLAPMALRRFRRQAQIVMQDPFAALSPRMRVREILTEPLEIHDLYATRERRERAAEQMRVVGLDPAMIDRFPHAFSGGQRQRISIARALMLEPRFLVCDEPTSALDVSVQAQILDLLEEIRETRALSYLFISHDLAVVARLADRVAVMRAGRIVELAPPSALFSAPLHPYTRALIAASPEPDPARRIDVRAVAAGAGDPSEWPEPFRFEDDAAPELIEAEDGHFVRRAA